MAVFPLAAGGNAEDRPLRYALMGNPDSLDPHKTSGTLTFQVLKSVYDTLVEPDETGKIIPALAESWTISANGKIWTFRLRQGVSFHNGEPFTSRDVAATIRRIQAPATASPKSAEYAAITEIRALDDFTVQFLLSAPSAPLLASLASGWSAILPAPLIEAGHDFASRPVGTGPFVFEEWLRDNKISLKKNPSYWLKGKPKISALEFRVIPERAVQVQGLLTGQIDAAEIFDAADVALLEKAPGVQIKKNLTSMVAVLAMNTSREPLSNLKVRQAVNQAIDKQKVLDIAYGGGVPVGTFMDSGDPYYKDFTGLYPYNPDAARKLLAEAGPGQERELEMVVPQNYEYHVRAAQIYQEFLGKIGLSVKIRLVDWSTWMSLYSGKMNFDFTVIAHTGKLDPDSRLWGYGQETTYIRWVNPQAAALIAEGRTLFAFSRRKAVYDQVLEIMAREVPCVYTGTPYRYSGMAKNVEGCAILPKLDTPDFRDAEFK
jgi:peptide/nickel transport system substrate-binding protein